MSKTVDLKSVLIGGLLVLLILCVVGAIPIGRPDVCGRFRIATSSGQEAYVLDTATGEVWSWYGGPRKGEFYAPKLKGNLPSEPNRPDAAVRQVNPAEVR